MIIVRAGQNHYHARWQAPCGTIHHIIAASRTEAVVAIASIALLNEGKPNQ